MVIEMTDKNGQNIEVSYIFTDTMMINLMENYA